MGLRRDKPLRSVFVTVGSTSFPAFVNAACDRKFAQALKKLGYTHVSVQFGRGPQPSLPSVGGVVYNAFRYKDSLDDDITAAELVISHAGAGTIMEALRAQKNLLVVVNNLLMSNHQVETARHFEDLGHLYYCGPRTLVATLKQADWETRVPLRPARPTLFGRFLDSTVMS